MFFPRPNLIARVSPGFKPWLCVLAGVAALTTSLHAGDQRSLVSITEREIQRRQQLVKDAGAELDAALELDRKGQHAAAAAKLMDIYQRLPDAPSAAELKGRVRSAYSEAACDAAEELLEQAKYQEANQMLDSVLAADVDPTNAEAKQLKKRAADSDRYPPALTPQHIENTKNAGNLLLHANSALDLGDYDKAQASFAAVLRLDPYNISARRGMERLERYKSEYLESARDHNRRRALNDIDSKWEDSVPASADLAAAFATSAGGASVLRGTREILDQKLRTIRIAKIEFNGASLDEVMEYLRVTSRDNDKDGTGVSYVVNVDPETRARPLSLSLTDVPLDELLRYITELSGTSYKVENNAVLIYSLSVRATSMITKKYRVPPDFIQTAAVTDAGAAPDPFAAKGAAGAPAMGTLTLKRLGAKEFLESRGVTFPEGSGATFSGSSSTLIVRNTADNLGLVDMLVENALGNSPKQIKISVKVVEVSQNNLNEKGFDTMLGQFNLPGSNRIYAGGGTVGNQGNANTFGAGVTGDTANGSIMSAGLRSSGQLFGVSSLDSEIANSKNEGGAPGFDSRSPTQFRLAGVFTDPQVAMSVRALQQQKGVDLVSMPSIVTKSGQKASVAVGREFPYPTEFDPPQVPQSVGTFAIGNVRYSSGSNSGPVTPTTPTAFEKKQLGITLEVEPTIGPDGKTVEVAVSPSVTEFEGFINYGSNITNSFDSARSNVSLFTSRPTPPVFYNQPNLILQPVFRRSSVGAGAPVVVTIYDGNTILLGALVTERSGDIQDKVPMIGDIPLIGQFWQSKVRNTQKKAVLFYLTIEIIDPTGQRINTASTSATAGQ